MKQANPKKILFIFTFLAFSINGCRLMQQNSKYDAKSNPIHQSEEVAKEQKSLDTYSEGDSTEIGIAKNRFDNISFPQESCGDTLPEDHRVYPVEIRPVGIPYSKENLTLIKKHFCKDAFKKFDVLHNKDVIQIASFLNLSYEELLELSEIISFKISNVEVSYLELNVLESKLNYTPPENSPKYIESVAEAAKLTPAQAEKLISLGEVANPDDPNLKFILSIVVPTYMPPGFKVDELFISYYEEEGSRGMYSLTYRNPSTNSCFSISGFPQPPIGEEPSGYDQVKVTSSDLGEIVLEHTNSDGFEGIDYISNPGPYFLPFPGSFHAYDFNSPGSDNRKCKSVSLSEAVKIAESLKYLNP